MDVNCTTNVPIHEINSEEQFAMCFRSQYFELNYYKQNKFTQNQQFKLILFLITARTHLAILNVAQQCPPIVTKNVQVVIVDQIPTVTVIISNITYKT